MIIVPNNTSTGVCKARHIVGQVYIEPPYPSVIVSAISLPLVTQ